MPRTGHARLRLVCMAQSLPSPYPSADMVVDDPEFVGLFPDADTLERAAREPNGPPSVVDLHRIHSATESMPEFQCLPAHRSLAVKVTSDPPLRLPIIAGRR